MAAGKKPGTGPAQRGSRLQLQLYVNRNVEAFDAAIRAQVPELSDATFDWISPKASDEHAPYHEYQDAAFLRALGLGEDATASLGRFWPSRGGPQWDGLGVATWSDGRRGELLIEAKANVPELLGGRHTACGAGTKSLITIARALRETRAALVATGSDEAWVGPLYQTANRLAHLHFLRVHASRADAWFLHVLFENDPTYRPTDRVAWNEALSYVSAELGLPSLVPHVAHVFVEGLPEPPGWPA